MATPLSLWVHSTITVFLLLSGIGDVIMIRLAWVCVTNCNYVIMCLPAYMFVKFYSSSHHKNSDRKKNIFARNIKFGVIIIIIKRKQERRGYKIIFDDYRLVQMLPLVYYKWKRHCISLSLNYFDKPYYGNCTGEL